jgi:hypothetical protein
MLCPCQAAPASCTACGCGAGGHPANQGVYHYHSFQFGAAWRGDRGTFDTTVEVDNVPYLTGGLTHPDGHSKILGWALDGYPVYGPIGYTDATNATSGVGRLRSSYSMKVCVRCVCVCVCGTCACSMYSEPRRAARGGCPAHTQHTHVTR